MKYFSFCPFLFMVILVPQALAQNLVPNPSFEEYLVCPEGTAGFSYSVVDWYSFALSPDYFNVCNNDLLGTAGVPGNAWGFQFPITGNAYASVVTYTHLFHNEREYIAAPLLEALVSGQEYYVMFYISHFDGGVNSFWRCASNRFGLKFFEDPSFDPQINVLTPSNSADIEYNLMFSDSTNWTLVEGWFTPSQSFNWIALGNFYDDSQTDTLHLGYPSGELNQANECLAINYIENVCITLNPMDCQYLLSNGTDGSVSQLLNVFPNPAREVLFVNGPNGLRKKIQVFNSLGELIFTEDFFMKQLQINCTAWAKGMYFLKMALDDGSISSFKIMKS